MTSWLEALKQAEDFLKERNFENPRFEAEYLLSAILNLKRGELYLLRDKKLSPKQLTQLKQFLKRRESFEPLQYIVGSTSFLGYEIKVDKRALIPRPETEILALTVIDFFKGKKGNLKIADIGTGSGALAIALAKNLENSLIYATDSSKQAIDLAKKNIYAHSLSEKISLFCGDLFEPLKNFSFKFDAVVSNPPYVSKAEYENLPQEIKNFEPKQALLGGKEGLDFHRKIIRGAKGFLKENGLLALEIGANQGEKVKKLLEENAYSSIKIKKDLNDLDRVVLAERN
jgi:release factor glutamine methyltransferase